MPLAALWLFHKRKMRFPIEKNPYRLVALDIGNTLIRQFLPGMHRALGLPDDGGGVDLGIEPFRPSFEKLLLGRISEEDYLTEFNERFQGRWTKEEILQAHYEYLLPSIAGMPELIRGMINTGSHFVFFTDINTIHFRRFRALTAGEYDDITDVVGSNDVHAMKPSVEMFRNFEERFGKPDLYLDDRQLLIDAAIARGWYAVQAGDAERLYRVLFSCNL